MTTVFRIASIDASIVVSNNKTVLKCGQASPAVRSALRDAVLNAASAVFEQ
jgi:hypothetical protein